MGLEAGSLQLFLASDKSYFILLCIFLRYKTFIFFILLVMKGQCPEFSLHQHHLVSDKEVKNSWQIVKIPQSYSNGGETVRRWLEFHKVT